MLGRDGKLKPSVFRFAASGSILLCLSTGNLAPFGVVVQINNRHASRWGRCKTRRRDVHVTVVPIQLATVIYVPTKFEGNLCQIDGD